MADGSNVYNATLTNATCWVIDMVELAECCCAEANWSVLGTHLSHLIELPG